MTTEHGKWEVVSHPEFDAWLDALRILFYFDKRRDAVLLVGGDKAGNWSHWYDENIPVAEQRIREHLRKLADEEKQAAEAAKTVTRPNNAKNRRRRK